MGKVQRRQFLTVTGALLASFPTRPWAAAATRTLGILSNTPKPGPEEHARLALPAALVRKLATLGWIEGKNLNIDSVWSGGDAARLPALVAEFSRRPVDVILVTSTAAAVAAARGTTTVPIILAGASAYPVECGLIKSYGRPGTNVTGVAWFQSIDVHTKLAEFVREIVPSARRLAWLVFPADLITVSGGEFSPKRYYAEAARALGFEFSYYECRNARDIESAFTALRKWGTNAVIVEPAALSFVEARRIADLAKVARLPAVCGQTQNVAGGGLLGYSPIHIQLWEQAAPYVDRVFRGARPAEMPVAMPTRLELVVNLRTAKELGITIPPSILLRADRVIE